MSRTAGPETNRSLKAAGLLLCAALLGTGCSVSPSLQTATPAPSYLGAAPAHADTIERPADEVARVSPGKVLSAIVFERVTGLEVDPARLIER